MTAQNMPLLLLVVKYNTLCVVLWRFQLLFHVKCSAIGMNVDDA